MQVSVTEKKVESIELGFMDIYLQGTIYSNAINYLLRKNLFLIRIIGMAFNINLKKAFPL